MMLPITDSVVEATFLQKLNRFVAVVEYAGRVVHAHVPTSSRMRELLTPGAKVLLAERDRAGRATAYDLIMAYAGDHLISVDSRVPNRLLDLVLRAGALPEFVGWQYARREVCLGQSRLDFLLTQGARRCWVEAKSVTLVEQGTALFPDAPTERGARHLGELAAAVRAGDRAAALFIIQRNDAQSFSPHRRLDPVFAHALEEAMRQGVEAYAYTCCVSPHGITLDHRVETFV